MAMAAGYFPLLRWRRSVRARALPAADGIDSIRRGLPSPGGTDAEQLAVAGLTAAPSGSLDGAAAAEARQLRRAGGSGRAVRPER